MSVCNICPRRCVLSEGKTGFCRARACLNNKIVPLNYGKITSLALDPIEKKPLYHFYPNSKILSVGSFGCNLKCPFCQNYTISMADVNNTSYRQISPEELVKTAIELKNSPLNNIGVAFTYNEPLLSYEYVKDCAVLLKKAGLKTVLVTNGCFNDEILDEILPLTDALNIDLKGFSKDYYDYVCGDFECVKNTIKKASSCCHVEVTTLVVPTKNDSEDQMKEEASWLADISKDIVLHISRYFPAYQSKIGATPVQNIYALKDVAKQYLKYVYTGNC